jgi:alpha-ketoglutaric semialdehyde dehydrogenase
MTFYPNMIGGERLSSDDRTLDINPSDTRDVVGEFAQASPGQIAAAAAVARAAFPAWSRSTAHMRSEILFRAAEELRARGNELGELLAREEGKILADGVGEVARAAQILRFFAGEALRIPGERLPQVRPGVDVDVSREAVGVVGLITPWNFPIAIPAWKLAPALAFGNCVLLKPAENTPACAWALVDILLRAGLPPGVLNLVMGRGSVIGSALIDHVDAVSFTGSAAVGQRIAAQASARGIRYQLEMGGKNPLVVLDDADLECAVGCALNGAFFQTGQRCTASSRLIVTAGIHDQFVGLLTERMQELKVGNALDPATQIGPVVSASQLESNLAYTQLARQEGAVCTGGDPLERDQPGYYMEPGLFTETTPQMRINREEIFGPIASIIRVGNYEEALSVANDTEFGLSAGICTRSLKYARDFQRNCAAGMVMVNLPTAGVDYHAPFGGRKGSSYGPREQGRYAADFYTIVKTSYISSGE